MMDMFGIDRMFANVGLALAGIVFLWLIWIPVGGYVAFQKRRGIVEGLLLGTLGPFGAVIEALLSTKDGPNASSARPSQPV